MAVGAVAGLRATAVMSVVFAVGHAVGLIGRLPPRIIVDTISPQLDVESSKGVAVVAHLGYGAGAGAIYTAVTPRPSRNIGSGILFGLAVWAAGYEGWLPFLGILPRAHRDKRGRALVILAAHVVYGAALGRGRGCK
jgi:hypothetical protein